MRRRLSWDHPDADPLADLRDHIRQAEVDYCERLNASASAAAENVRRILSEQSGEPLPEGAFAFPHFDLSPDLTLDLTAAEHLAAASASLRDAARDLALAAKVGAGEARYHARRLVRRLRRQATPSVPDLFPRVSVRAKPSRYFLDEVAPMDLDTADRTPRRPAWWSGL